MVTCLLSGLKLDSLKLPSGSESDDSSEVRSG